ncbi:MAG: zinc-binding alcohol dehydrogenase [Acidobacteriota bacterium]|nr:zinc-binding alcohol dehydrogenase [Acidobacteriota bacterium]
MKQAILHGAGDLRLEDRPLETGSLRDGQTLVKTEVTAFSTGTDLGNYEGRSTELPGAPDYPRAVGYSNVGRIVADGRRVFSMKPHQSAFIAEPDDLLVPVPDGVSSEQASLAYLTQLGLAALRQARYETGENVAIIGLGVIGLATAGLARAMGAKVAAIANSSVRAEAALNVGAHAAFQSHDLGSAEDLGPLFGTTGADLVILTANTWDAYRLAVELARRGGRVSVLGFPGRAQPPPDFNPLDAQWFYGKQLTLLGAGASPRVECAPSDLRFNLRRNLEYIFDLMADGALQLESLITHRFPAARMIEAYELARQHSKELVAAVFDWREED